MKFKFKVYGAGEEIPKIGEVDFLRKDNFSSELIKWTGRRQFNVFKVKK